jgi:hypothetical protein
LLHIDSKRFVRFTRPGHAVTGDRHRSGRERRMRIGYEKAVPARAFADEIPQVACACVDADVLVEQLADPIVNRREQSGRVYVPLAIPPAGPLPVFTPRSRRFANLRYESRDR